MLAYLFIAVCFLSVIYAVSAKRRHDELLEVVRSMDRNLDALKDEVRASRLALDDIDTELKRAIRGSQNYP